MKKYFFSPIGGNDPVSSATERDGSMLHICRQYKPDEVYLYLSREMVVRHRKDNRYCYCIEKLGEQLNHHFEVHCIEDSDNSEVQEYDYYYDAFEPYLQKIKRQMEEGDILLVNVSSGTPAMKSALVLFAVLDERRIVPIQVTTPEKSINKHPGKDPDYDPEYYWEINEDNKENAENRCKQPQLFHFDYRIKRQSLIRYLQNYNYAAAMTLGEELKEDLPDGVRECLEYAVARMQLDLGRMKKLLRSFSKREREILCPLWSENGADDQRMSIYEYALGMKIKIRNKEYADFSRSISPILTDLFEGLLKEKCGINVAPYIVENAQKVRVWDTELLEKEQQGQEWIGLMEEKFGGKLRNHTPLAASNLESLLLHYLKDEKLKEEVRQLRMIEGTMRNLAAHEIISVTDENFGDHFKDNPNFSVHEAYREIQHMTQMVLNFKSELWDAYDKMNELICSKLQNAGSEVK